MIKSVKRLGAAVLSAVMMLTAVATPLGDNLPAVRESTSLTAGAAVSASKWGTAITNKNDSRVLSALNNITSQQKNISSTVQSGKSVKDMIYYLVFESEYAVYGGKTIPNNHCNANADGGTSSNTFAEEKVYGYKIKMATTRRGCYWYAGYISNIIYGKDGAGDSNSANIICRNGGLTSSSLKSFITKYLQAGEHIRMESSSNSPHSISYISYDANGFYYLDYLGYKNENAGLRYITYDKFISVVNKYSYKVYAYNANTAENNSSTPTPSQSVTDHYKLTSPDGYQTIRKEASTSSANLGSINAGNIVCVTKYSSDNKWGYLTYNGVSGWIRLYYVEKTGSSHSYGSWYTKTSATCTSGGTEERKCSCGATESRSTSALGHNYGSWSTVTNATCTSGGSEKRTCSRCSNSETRSTSALGHNFGGIYYEAVHPHYYGHKCSRCGYSEKTGGNLDYYYLCATCTHLTKPEVTKITGDLVDNSEITIEWTASESDKLANYWLDVFDPDGLNVVDVSTGKINSYTFTPVKTGTYTIKTYAAPIGNKDGSGSVGAETTIEIGCNHNYSTEIVNPTYDNEGYTLHTCTKCGDSYISDYTAKLTLSKVTNFKVKSLTSTNVTLQWNKNTSASGYEIEQYKGGKWVNVAKITGNATTSYTVKGLAAGTAGYKFRMRAVKDGAYSDYTSVLTVNTNPYGVGGFKCSSKTSTSVTLKWNKGTTASGYQLQQYKNGKWVTIYTGTKATDTSYTVKNLKAGTAGYRFRIRAYKTYGNTKQYGSWSSEVKVNTNPYGVSGFKCSSKTSTSVTLKWNKGTTASGYQLQQYKNGKWVTIYTGTKATNTSYTVKKLKAGTAGYRFRIRAYKTYGNTKQYGSWSSEVKVNTNPYGVSGFKAKSTAKNSITLGWNKGTTASGYQLQQYKGGKWVTVYTGTKATSTSYTVKRLKANTSYKFRIRAYKTYGNTKQYGSWSKVLTVKTKR